MRRLPVMVALLLAVVLSACQKAPPDFTLNQQVPADQRTEAEASGEGGGGEPAGEAAGTFVADASLAFTMAPDTLPAGESTIELVVEGGAPHDVTFEGVDGGEPVVQAGGNETATGTVTLEPGSYTYFCSVPGHRQAGMEGMLTVE